ncbi:uncharacterized protein LOC124152609 isoform X2 [Haliotis rufescens]|uniref:uncharacterized protein LOC124152609 isoform X2 n=1 Tax=Haliotis rufescens TaxID=6454 RepID=UPI00201F224E|nr:uncharacterized protein LOC124152609 isoform X2 [Haliotis rufescens]
MSKQTEGSGSMRKPVGRCRRGVARAWRYLARRSSINLMLCGCCTVSLIIMAVNLHGSQDTSADHGVRGRFPDVMGMFRQMEIHHHPSDRGFQIKEVKSDNLTYYDLFPVGRRFMAREKQVQDGCRGRETDLLGLSSEKWAFDRIEVDTDRGTLYCPLLKVGSTFWRRVFYAMRQNSTINTPYDISINKALMSKRETLHKLLPLNRSSTQQYLKESVNIMFVREPFSRLISGYVDKLFAPNPYFWTVIGKFIISNYRKNPSPQSLRCGHDVTFPEFVQYVVDTEARNDPHRDAHFTPTYDQCKPCQIPYNIIGKMETFKDDTAFILNALGYNVSTNSLRLWSLKAEEDAVIDSTLSPFGWKKKIQKCMSFHEAAKRIWHKMQIRGIVRKDYAMPFTVRSLKTTSSRQFIEAMLKGRRSPDVHGFLKSQKQEVLQRAYQLVPRDDLERIRKFFKPDFELFGYDMYPKHIFPDYPSHTGNNWLFNVSGV